MHENNEQAFGNLQNMIIPHLKFRDSKSPPKAQVDEASLQLAMDKNKESLKMKLMNRRPFNQLVDQGIIPSLKVPPHYYEQRQKLERAKMGDFLKHKIQKRPDRQELIQQHILEDTRIDPSLQDKQRQLKKARLADDLNDRLSHRPGPLELVKGNILVADEKFAQAIKEGQIPFKRTCEGQAVRHPLPSFAFEDDSGSDVALSPPQDVLDQSLSGMSSMDSVALSPYTNQESPTSSMGELRITTSTPPSTLSSPVSAQSGGILHSEQTHKESTTTTRSRKKSKPKSSQPKTRTIKFHEYKGPPSAQKNQTSQTQAETSYELLLQQQQLFLQWHLEWQQKYPQMILPVTHQPSNDQSKANGSPPQSTEHSLDLSVPSPQPLVSKFEDLKVNDLKAELKRRNLPVSGSKPQLIERLKNHLDSNSSTIKASEKPSTIETNTVPINMSSIILDTLPTIMTQQPTIMTQQDPVTSVLTVEAAPLNNSTHQLAMSEDQPLLVYKTVPVQGQIITSRPSSVAPMDIEMNSNSDAMDCTENANAINENIVKLQQKKIQQLQRELQRSKMQLQQQQWLQQQQVKQHQAQQQVLLATQPVPIAPAIPATQLATTSIPQASQVDAKALQKLQQHLQQKFQQQQLLQQLQQQAGNGGKFAPGSPAMSAAVKANLAAFIHNQQANSVRLPNTLAPVNQQNAAAYTNFKNILLCPTQNLQAIVEKPRANSLPNGFGQQKLVWTSSVPNFSNVLPVKVENVASKKSPPDYNEATKQLTKVKQEKSQSSGKRSGRKSVKSPAVDEVLEILIKNGELPPSAAQDPPTPTTPENQKLCNMPPTFPSITSVGMAVTNNAPSQLVNQDTLNLLPVKMESEPSTNSQEQTPSLGFDPSLLLELQNIESMDLGMLVDCAPQSSFSDMSQQANNSCLSNSDNVMDVELPEWLEVYSNNNPLVSTASPQRGVNYNSDPLLPSMGNSQEILDMFSLDDLDFKAPSDTNILSWDKVDFAT